MGEPASFRHASLPARIGKRRGHVPLLTFEKGTQVAQPVKQFSEWIKSGNGEGSTCPSHSLRKRGGTGESSDISEFITCQQGSAEGRRGHVPLTTFERGGGTDGPACVRPRKEGSHAPSNFNKGAQVCLYP